LRHESHLLLSVNTPILHYLPLLVVPFSLHELQHCHFPPFCDAPSVGVSSPGGGARPPLSSWGRRCLLVIPGGGSTYAPGRRQSPPSPTRPRGLPFGTWGPLIIRYVCVAILPVRIIKMKDFFGSDRRKTPLVLGRPARRKFLREKFPPEAGSNETGSQNELAHIPSGIYQSGWYGHFALLDACHVLLSKVS